MNYVTTKITVTNCKAKRRKEQERKTSYLLIEVQSKRQQDRQEHTLYIEKHKGKCKEPPPAKGKDMPAEEPLVSASRNSRLQRQQSLTKFLNRGCHQEGFMRRVARIIITHKEKHCKNPVK